MCVGKPRKKETYMSKNLTRKGLALVSGAALALTSLVGIAAPANAAGEVVLKPTTGTGATVFSTDPISLTTSVQTVGGPATNTLAYRIDNPDQHQLLVSFTGVTAGTIVGYKETGAAVAVGTFTGGSVLLDFDDAETDIVAAVFHTLTGHAASTAIQVKLDADAEADIVGINDTVSGATELAYGALTTDAKLSVQSWVEVQSPANYASVDATFASSKVDVTFVDPKNVSVISEVVRSKGNGQPLTYLADVDVHVTTDADLTSTALYSAADALQGFTLTAGDRILFSGQNPATENGIYIVQAADTAPVRSAVAADMAEFPSAGVGVLVKEGTDDEVRYTLTGKATVNLTANTPSSVFATHLNQVGDKYLTANLRFSRSDINLNQVVLTKWNYGVTSSQADDSITLTSVSLRAANVNWAVANHNLEVITPVGHSATNAATYGNLLVRAAVAGDALAANKTYQVRFQHKGTDAPVAQSAAFTTVQNAVDADAVKVTSIVTSTTDAKTDGTLRAGTKAFTYRAQAVETDGTTDVETANIPMVAVVQAGAFMPTGESISVSGSTKTITRANEAVVVAGLSNADGRFSVTVTSTTAAALQSYSVTFHIADGVNLGAFVVDAAPITGTYAAAAATTVTATPAIAASSEVAVKVSVTDQFGQAISTRGAAPLNVELRAPDKTKLEQFAAVVDGSANFTFANYLAAGGSDVLTARVYTGTSTSPTYTALSTQVNLFAPVAVTAINVAPEVTGVVVNYVDFITGKTSAANPGPSTGATTYTGTVVNANGAGIPGAAVTISGTGFQFKTGTDFTVDSVTLTTDAAGTFSVEMWTSVASAAGNKLTVTSGDKTASTLIKSAVPTGATTISTKNLSFSWNIPATLVMNTTYAVTASVTDKHGNGVANAFVKFSGFGAAQFNGVNEVTRSTDRNGQITVFLRSLKDVDGPSAIGAELTGIGGATDVSQFITNEGLAAVYTDVATTSWDESKWTSVIETPVNFLKTAPAASATGKVNVGSFNGKLVVYALGLDGAKISWKVAGKWGTAVADGNELNRFDRPVGASGVNVIVEIYVNGSKQLTKTVLTK
jgi:hypothetical protein